MKRHWNCSIRIRPPPKERANKIWDVSYTSSRVPRGAGEQRPCSARNWWTVHCDSVTFQPHLPTKLNKGSIVATVRWMWIQVFTCSTSQQNPKIASYSQSAPRQCVCQRIVETRMGCEFTIYIKTSWVMENLAGWSSAISSTHCN